MLTLQGPVHGTFVVTLSLIRREEPLEGKAALSPMERFLCGKACTAAQGGGAAVPSSQQAEPTLGINTASRAAQLVSVKSTFKSTPGAAAPLYHVALVDTQEPPFLTFSRVDQADQS